MVNSEADSPPRAGRCLRRPRPGPGRRFSKPLQELVTEYCWGTVWARHDLALAERSLINLAMISALNRPHELKIHVMGALRNGVTREKIREVLLQVAIYCGVPAAVDSFRIARDAIAEFDASES